MGMLVALEKLKTESEKTHEKIRLLRLARGINKPIETATKEKRNKYN